MWESSTSKCQRDACETNTYAKNVESGFFSILENSFGWLAV
jgi:hypothetical protein